LPFSYGALGFARHRSGAVAIVPGSPADKAGIMENDILLEADGVKTRRRPLRSFPRSLRKKVGRYDQLKGLSQRRYQNYNRHFGRIAPVGLTNILGSYEWYEFLRKLRNRTYRLFVSFRNRFEKFRKIMVQFQRTKRTKIFATIGPSSNSPAVSRSSSPRA